MSPKLSKNYGSPAKTCVGTIFVVHPYMDSAYKLLASYILPKEISESFDLVDVTSDKLPGNSHDMLHLYLDEKPIPPDNRTDLTPNGFYPESTALDFPIREYTTVLHVRRRRWLDPDGTTVSKNWNIATKGTRISPEFAAFLKETVGLDPDNC